MRILACLDGLPAYAEYLDRGFAGTLPLPGYDVALDGSVVIFPGEVYCRVAGCGRSQHRFVVPRSLREHVASHGLSVPRVWCGRKQLQVERGARIWYSDLVAAAMAAEATQSNL
ncbi:unnamed protein product [Penicillium bialowiezense]